MLKASSPVAALAIFSFATLPSAMAIDPAPLWNFADPARSEQRFRAALATATGDDALILQTQIARSYGLRQQFAKARDLLESLAGQLAMAGPEARARHALELGRTYASATHPPESQTAEARARARAAFEAALAAARTGQLDHLAIDALHMLAFVDTAPADQLKWAEQALAIAQASTQPQAKQWEASLRNNAGYALHQLGRLGEALVQFRHALQLREAGNDPAATRIARWMVAWTLRGLGRTDDALAMQLALEADCQAAGTPDPYVFEELEILYRDRGNEAMARKYAGLRQGAAR